MSSRLWLTLRSQVSLIEKTYITFAYDPLGNYSRENLLNAASYLLLIHAELETYIEGCVRRAIRASEKGWTKNRRTCRPLVASCLFSSKSATPDKHSTKDELGGFVTSALKNAEAKLSGNHGIKEHNIIPLLHVIGFPVEKADPILIAELDAIGSIRGDHAHNSARQHFAARFDPFAIKSKIEGALKLLEKFDVEFSIYYQNQFGK
jgi:hypothetical protein